MPTFLALIESHKPGLLVLDKPLVLLIAQQDELVREAWLHVESEASHMDYQFSDNYSDFSKGDPKIPNCHF